MSFEESLAMSLKSIAVNAATPNITVTDGEVKAAATRMARCGYDFSRTPNSLKALRSYLQGKSICLAGTKGSGKTMWFKALQSAGLARNDIAIYSLPEHGNAFVSVIVDDIKSFADTELVIDDVGTESNWSGHRNDDILSRVIGVREGTDKRTHYTTNLSSEQLKERYDERVVSRLRLCVFIPMVGADNRAATANAEEAAFRAKCADPASWMLCKERCPKFVNGGCLIGASVPPLVRHTTPESMCGVGDRIPYRDSYLLDTADALVQRIARLDEQGEDWSHLKQNAERWCGKLTERGLPADCLGKYL